MNFLVLVCILIYLIIGLGFTQTQFSSLPKTGYFSRFKTRLIFLFMLCMWPYFIGVLLSFKIDKDM